MDNIINALKMTDTVVVDVRSQAEYMDGHVSGSINIPVNEIPARLDEFKNMKKIVLCCASGTRSQMAAKFLQQNSIECYDGGTWLIVNSYLNS